MATPQRVACLRVPRSHRGHRSGAPVYLTLLVCAALPHPLRAQGNAVDAVIRGQVVDETSGQGVPHALVEFLNGRTRIRATAQTDETGAFVLPDVPTGAFRLRASRMGYARALTPYWRIQSGEALSVIVWIHPEAVLLAPLEITARTRSLSPVIAGFYQRAERQMGGVFITREQIESLSPFRITDVLEATPGVMIERVGAEGRRVRLTRAGLTPGGDNCQTQIFVDGILASRGREPIALDELASPSQLEGIEIHRGVSTLPPEFVTPDARCGVIALWTRRGG